MKPVIAIFIEYGFHEVKKYIHSGFYKILSEEFEIVWFIVDKKNDILNEYFESTGFPVVYIDFNVIEKRPLRRELLNHTIQKAWMRNQGIRLHHYYRQQRGLKPKDKILGLTFFKMIIEKNIFKSLHSYYHSEELEQLFGKYQVSNVFTTSYRSAYSKEFVYTAQNIGAKSWFLVNSWKDLYLGSLLPDRLTGLFVWSESMKREYLKHMPYLNSNTINVSGNPTFDYMLFSELTHTRKYYAEKYNIDLNSDWLYYTMLPPGNMNDEIEIVRLIANTLRKKYSRKKKVILLRRNPNHNIDDFVDLDFPDNVVLTDHYCTYDKESDMILQSPEGEVEWFDLVNYISANISIPSTVTLEFLLREKPVFNIGFSQNNDYDTRLDQYIYSEFYEPLFARNDVVLCHSSNELLIEIENFKKHKVVKYDDLVHKPKEGFSSPIVTVLKNSQKDEVCT